MSQSAWKRMRMSEVQNIMGVANDAPSTKVATTKSKAARTERTIAQKDAVAEENQGVNSKITKHRSS